MFRIRKVADTTTPANQRAIVQAQDILRAQFSALKPEEIAKLPRQLENPLKYGFRAVLLVAEDDRGAVKAFALVLHAPDVGMCYLDFIATAPRITSGGVGGALYERVREEAQALGAHALYFECLPDDPALSPKPELRAQNAARLRFYERWGARPLIHTRYETPLKPDATDPPYLVLDLLGAAQAPRREQVRAAVRAILERKYRGSCTPAYTEMVLGSIVDDPVQLRPPRYQKKAPPAAAVRQRKIALFVNTQHEIHHVRERGYVEAPARISSILKALEPTGWFERRSVQHFSEEPIKAVHQPEFVDYLRRACQSLEPGESVYPYVFPLRNATRPPRELPLRAGYYCIDTFTPLNRNAYLAARSAVDAALSAAQALLDGYPLAYALVRPPGHHAERRAFGGFCYFNSAAVAAHRLSAFGKVAVLDVDYHHGNGTQDIFFTRDDVLTVSLHGTPRLSYPYFSGFDNETGEGPGKGYNLNLPLPEGLDGAAYRTHLEQALARIRRFKPAYLVVSLGLDTAKDDPTGSFTLKAADFAANGRALAGLGLPTLVVQEGGYRVRSLGSSARGFFAGLLGLEGTPSPPAPPSVEKK